MFGEEKGQLQSSTIRGAIVTIVSVAAAAGGLTLGAEVVPTAVDLALLLIASIGGGISWRGRILANTRIKR